VSKIFWKYAVFFLLCSAIMTQGTAQPQEVSLLPTINRHPRTHTPSGVVKKTLFTPWRTGPLLTPGAHVSSPGSLGVQPSIHVRKTFAKFDPLRHLKRLSDDIWTVQPTLLIQMGWLSWLDFSINTGAFYTTQAQERAFHWGDSSLALGIQLLEEHDSLPAVKLSVTESFPLGKYEKLDPRKKGIDATGSGSYITKLGLDFSKEFDCFSAHPVVCSVAFSYDIPTSAHVRGYNTYGGGEGTKGSVKVGHTTEIGAGIELSLTQEWVFALDIAYTHSNRSTFSGDRGTALIKTGSPPSVGTPSGYYLSTALAIEYNHSEHLGCIAGVWFPIVGRNSPAFVTGVLSMSYSW